MSSLITTSTIEEDQKSTRGLEKHEPKDTPPIAWYNLTDVSSNLKLCRNTRHVSCPYRLAIHRPGFERMELIEKEDLERDPVVKWQDKYYPHIAFSFGLVFPTLVGSLWGDAICAFIWGGLFAKVCVLHGTFLVNSLAHWQGLQPYSDENSSRRNLHAFPHDYRSGISLTDYDPTKWVILVLHELGLVTGLRRARPEDMVDVLEYMKRKKAGKLDPEDDSWEGEAWSMQKVRLWAIEKAGRCVVLIDGYAVDATSYLGEHPGGAALLRRYAVGTLKEGEAEWAFNGGLNNHERAARQTMKKLRVAKIVD